MAESPGFSWATISPVLCCPRCAVCAGLAGAGPVQQALKRALRTKRDICQLWYACSRGGGEISMVDKLVTDAGRMEGTTRPQKDRHDHAGKHAGVLGWAGRTAVA